METSAVCLRGESGMIYSSVQSMWRECINRASNVVCSIIQKVHDMSQVSETGTVINDDDGPFCLESAASQFLYPAGCLAGLSGLMLAGILETTASLVSKRADGWSCVSVFKEKQLPNCCFNVEHL